MSKLKLHPDHKAEIFKIPSGSKGGSTSSTTPVEAADNLFSVNKIKILLAVSDGEVDDTFSQQNLYFDNVPVQNTDGSYNFENVYTEFRSGTQVQDYIAGMDGASNETTIARDVTTTTPYTLSVTNTQLSAVRLKVYFAYMTETSTSSGDINGSSVNFAIDLAVDGGSYEEYGNYTVTGKTTSGYDKSIRVNLPASYTGALIRVRRITADSTSSYIVNAMQVTSYAEVIDAKFRYPMTGLVYVEIDSKMFPDQIPTISIMKKWKLIKVPSNYDPVARTYSGTWDGTFKTAWSNNPAWILYDIVTNQRYGLDQRELGINIDKWSLYEAGEYCDELVPDGKGGTEPRYLCDVVIQDQVEAYQLVADLASIFRGISFYNGESISIVVDKPRDVSYLFTNENVQNGYFMRSYATEKSMYSVCNVSFDDRENYYVSDVEPVFDAEAALRFNYNSTDITAIGCTRRSEANRRGRWVLKTNLASTIINFTTGLEGMIPSVGQVIAVSDVHFGSNYGLNLSGRVMEVSGIQVFFIMKVDARAGDSILMNRPDGVPVSRTIASVAADGMSLTLNVGFGFDVQPDTVFAIDRADITPERYIVTNIAKADSDSDDAFTYSITGVQYDENKYDEIDYGVSIDDRPTSVVAPDQISSPNNVTLSSFSRIVQGLSVETMVISWDKVQYAETYDVQWRKGTGNWVNAASTANTEVDIEGIYAGNYSVRVRTVATSGFKSAWSAITSASLTGKVGEPGSPINLTATTNEVFGIRVKWGFSDGSGDTAYTEIYQSATGSDDNASQITLVPYPGYEYWHSILPAGYVNWYKVRTIDKIGNTSDWTPWVRGMATDDVDAISAVVIVDIEQSQGFKDLAELATETASKVKDSAQTLIQNALANDADVKRLTVESGARKAQYEYSLQLIANETEARATQVEQLSAEFNEEIASSVATFQEALATETEARATAIQQLNASLAQTNANVTTNAQAITSESETRASQVTALSTRVGNNETALVQKLDSWQNATSIGSSYTVSLGMTYNSVTYNCGLNIQLTQVSGTTLAQAVWDVDRFAVGRISGGSIATLPFFIENSQVFMQSAVIKDGSITNAKIGGYIQSSNYVSGSAGWRLDKSGAFENNGSDSTGRMVMTNTSISVYDADGVLRVKMGKLS